MAYVFSLDDVAFLDSGAGRRALAVAERLSLSGRDEIGDMTRLRRACGDAAGAAGAVAETVRLRRRAIERWGTTDRDVRDWLLTDTALQQASPPVVARYRAERITEILRRDGDDAVHDVTCSIGADLHALGATGLTAIGSDVDEVRLAMARHNLRASGLPVRLIRADARTSTTRGTLRYADPARRDGTGRRISSADTVPPLASLRAADRRHPPVLRLPPGIDLDHLGIDGEIEIVSWKNAVREAIHWPVPPGSPHGLAHRATVLAVGPGGRPIVREQLRDTDPADADIAPPGRFLVDPDPAIVRAHLVRHYACRHRLRLLDAHLAYLSGDTVPAGVRGFEVLDRARLSERTVRAWCRRDDVGTLEIKQRGTPVIPDELRRRVKPAGDPRCARTLVVARIGRAPTAFWCRAVVGGSGGDRGA